MGTIFVWGKEATQKNHANKHTHTHTHSDEMYAMYAIIQQNLLYILNITIFNCIIHWKIDLHQPSEW